MSDLHSGLGGLAIGLNVAAALIGLVAWLASRNPRPFWWILRAGQVLIMLEAVTGAALLLDGRDLPRLHLVYGLTPIAVAFLAEQLKLLATQTLLDKRGMEGGADVAKLPESEQRAFVKAVLRRELGVMATSAFIVATLAARAQGIL
ncbi:hypothetical protein OM076_03725 [Solirubrobacter ginsenosidimutans]|uniref:Uncharacterized protein n=1 Tax=Solirubrobacter ginsenosidimutans TaxID=490573 RepID=A0A9X3MQG9_9ACTN|nr:hypothetical protein [Solirubrobacter ginsenosidimutans]MDA0159365.1 hypothetical protein [Solirubrobacter ginsenosidimutans]